jgi:hypothetical protein
MLGRFRVSGRSWKIWRRRQGCIVLPFKPEAMRTIRTSSTDHDQQSQCVVSRILGICISELRFLRIVWFYRGSRGLLLYFYNRVRQTRFRRRSGVGGRENAFSASPPSTRTRGRTPSARASTTPRARARSTRHARANWIAYARDVAPERA